MIKNFNKAITLLLSKLEAGQMTEEDIKHFLKVKKDLEEVLGETVEETDDKYTWEVKQVTGETVGFIKYKPNEATVNLRFTFEECNK